MPKIVIPGTAFTTEQCSNILAYARNCAEIVNIEVGDFREHLRYRDKVYQRTLAVTGEQLKNLQATLRGTGKKSIGNMEVPIAMPQVESATAYQTGVFCTSYPVFGVIASADQQPMADQLETLFGQQSQKWGWVRNLIKAFRNGNKYNFGPIVTGKHWI